MDSVAAHASSESDDAAFLRHLRSALPYLEGFRETVMVLYLDGTLLSRDSGRLLEDVVLLHQAGLRLVLVPDVTPQLQAELERTGAPVRWQEQRLVLAETHLPWVRPLVASLVWELLHRFTATHSQLRPLTSYWIRAEPVDFMDAPEAHRCGRVQQIDLNALRAALDQSRLVIVPPLALGEKGREWVLSAAETAVALASGLRSRKLILIGARPLEMQGEGLHLTTEAMEQWLSLQTLEPGRQAEYEALIQGCRRGVARCQLIDGTLDGSLLADLLRPSGLGVMVTDRRYRQVRPARLSDIPAIQRILQRPVQQAALVLRTPEDLNRHIDRFLLFCLDEEIMGCCELIRYEAELAVEVGSLVVDSTLRNRGVGRELLQAAAEQAREWGCTLLFSLTTGSAHVFVQAGMRPLSADQLPEQKRQAYDFQDSVVYGKRLLTPEA